MKEAAGRAALDAFLLIPSSHPPRCSPAVVASSKALLTKCTHFMS